MKKDLEEKMAKSKENTFALHSLNSNRSKNSLENQTFNFVPKDESNL